MSLNLEDKKALVAEVSGAVSDAQAAVLAEYRGLTVAQMTELRVKAREQGVYIRVLKNTLAKRVVAGTELECLTDYFTGPLAFAASEDPVAVAKVVSEFAKANDKMQITAGAMNGNLMSVAEVEALAKLPSRDELLAKLMGTMQAPVQKLAQTINEVPGKFVRTLAAYQQSKEAA